MDWVRKISEQRSRVLLRIEMIAFLTLIMLPINFFHVLFKPFALCSGFISQLHVRNVL